MTLRYRTEAINGDGGTGTARVTDGMEVSVASPLAQNPDPDASNPEQLLALAGSTCLTATAPALVKRERRTAVRIEVELHDASEGPGYEFHVDTYLSAEGLTLEETADLLASAHARCPVSKLLQGATTVQVHAEEYAG
ncbi:MAG: OsmC family protein [Actinomycetota bacterium]|nr:OsmC family protein [Actinomycetota bacterium]